MGNNNIYTVVLYDLLVVWALLLKYPSAMTADGDKSKFINSVVLVQQQLYSNGDEPFFADNELILNHGLLYEVDIEKWSM